MKRVLYSSILIITILAGVAVAYTVWESSDGTVEQFLESGKKYYDQKKYPEAAIQFLHAIQLDPQSRDARYFAAQAYVNIDLRVAVRQLDNLLEYRPDDILANLLLCRIYLMLAASREGNFYRQASKIAQKVLVKEPQNVTALVMLGNAKAGLQDYRTSVEQFEKVVRLDPRNSTALISLGTYRALQQQLPEAEEAFLKAREVSPRDKNALLSLASYYRAIGDLGKSESVFKDAVAIYPTDKDVYLRLVSLYNQMKRFDDAGAVLRSVQARTPQDPEPFLLSADLEVLRNRAPEARKLLLDIKTIFPRNIDVATKLALNLIEDEPERARIEVDQILTADPTNTTGLILLGKLQFFAGQLDAAAATFGNEGALNSAFPEPHFFLGNIAVKTQQLDEAQDHYQKSLAVSSVYLPARIALAEVFLKKARLTDSRAEIRKALDVDPGYVPALLFKASLDRIEKNYPEAEKQLAALLKEQPDSAPVHRELGLYYASRDRASEAEKSLTRALELQPDSEQILQDLTRVYARDSKLNRAIELISRVSEQKRRAFHYELLGNLYTEGGRLQDAEKAYRNELERDPAGISANVHLTDQYIRTARLDEALEMTDELLKKRPSNAGAYVTRGVIYARLGRFEQAIQSYLQALHFDLNSSAAVSLARILVEEGRELDALGWAQTARRTQPGNPDAADTLGWTYYKLGNFVLARDQLAFAILKQPGNAVYQYHLAMIYEETGQLEEAETALKSALSGEMNFKEKGLAQAALNDLPNLKEAGPPFLARRRREGGTRIESAYR